MTLEERRDYEATIRSQWELFRMTPQDAAEDIADFISTEVNGVTHDEILAQLDDEDILKLDIQMRSVDWC